MDFRSFLIKYAEIGTKGKNRFVFEDALMRQMRRVLEPVGEFEVTKEFGRIYATASGEFDYEDALEALKTVFGIAWICPVVQVELLSPGQGAPDAARGCVGGGYTPGGEAIDTPVAVGAQAAPAAVTEDGPSVVPSGQDWLSRLKADVLAYVDMAYPDKHFTFKVDCRRADKSYPLSSEQINAALGEAILHGFPDTKVDVHKPDVLLRVELRRQVNIYSLAIPGPGGMPVGTNGKAMLLLSGGIDSPVAGYMIAKRGVKIDAIYFHAPPYTSDRARQKVVDLAARVAHFAGPVTLHVVNFTDIQLAIYEICPHEELTIIMRRYMMRIAQRVAVERGCQALITGESIGQVASQTVHSLAATNEVCEMPVFRPLIGFDKQEIIDRAEMIGTYETSILPYEDCCTIFVAKHPVTKPNLQMIKRSEWKLRERIDELVRVAVETREVVEVGDRE
ncbi:MAG: tRNA 4-thiouridine(8) synthase ThiI [Lachnospiraceae bacterium]|jgi:thiamine biosynthesis protein ThiI|nr:tRNA 4-thiouridine(8) synthase ThiI [Lachnospiraceae bacterium]